MSRVSVQVPEGVIRTALLDDPGLFDSVLDEIPFHEGRTVKIPRRPCPSRTDDDRGMPAPMKVENEIQSSQGFVIQAPVRPEIREQDNCRLPWGGRVVRYHGNTGPNEKKGCRQVAQGQQDGNKDGVPEKPLA